MARELQALSSRLIKATFNEKLAEAGARLWVPRIASMFSSDQATETYAWIGDAPKMRPWTKGPRSRQALKPYSLTVTNKKYEATLEVDEDDFRRDRTGSVLLRTGELAVRAAQLPNGVLTDLLKANGNAYDGAAMFHASSHVTQNGDVVNNAITYDVTTVAAPTVPEAEAAMLSAAMQIIGYKDDAGEPRNEDAKQFLVMVPPQYWKAFKAAVSVEYTAAGVSNVLMSSGLTFEVMMNARLPLTSTGADLLYVFRMDTPIKALIWQDEVDAEIKSLETSSDWYFHNDSRLFGVKRIGGAGYGRIDQVCRVQLV